MFGFDCLFAESIIKRQSWLYVFVVMVLLLILEYWTLFILIASFWKPGLPFPDGSLLIGRAVGQFHNVWWP